MESWTLDLGNILSSSEIDAMFMDDPEENNKPESTEETQEESDEENNTVEEETEESNLESVDGDTREGKEDTKSTKDNGKISQNNNFYSSIASALKNDGIFPDLDDDALASISTPEDFAEAVEKQVKARLDERQKRIDDALNYGVEPSEIQNYERTIEYLNSLDKKTLSDESTDGENLRKRLIYNDYINRGYSRERAEREVKKSIDAGTDIDDAVEAVKANLEFYRKKYDDVVEDARKNSEAVAEDNKKASDELKKALLEESVLGDFQVDKKYREKALDNLTKPVYTDKTTGERLTALQKYQKENPKEFLKNLGLLYTLTDGFSNMERLVKGKVRKEMKKNLRELETTLNNTSRTSDGSLNFMNENSSGDLASQLNWKLDL